MQNKVCIGIDQSYTQIGIAIVEGPSTNKGKVIAYNSYKYKGMKLKSEKRKFVSRLVAHAVKKFNPDVILVERIRTFSQGFISTAYIKTTGALIGSIVDTVYPIKVWSADTRSWKSHVCGSSKGMHKADKGVSVRFVRDKFGIETNDDEADAICIALYGLNFNKLMEAKLLKLEE